jgi:predicted homoserine dehydrogenase-like protein
MAHAKRSLRAGEELDGVGGYTCYGMIHNCDAGGDHPGVPICVADGMRLTRDVAIDERIDWGDVQYDSGREDVALFRRALRVSTE